MPSSHHSAHTFFKNAAVTTRLDCYTNEVSNGNIYLQIDCIEDSFAGGLSRSLQTQIRLLKEINSISINVIIVMMLRKKKSIQTAAILITSEFILFFVAQTPTTGKSIKIILICFSASRPTKLVKM